MVGKRVEGLLGGVDVMASGLVGNNKILLVTAPTTTSTKQNSTTIEVGLDMKMTLHHHHPPPPPTNTN